MEVAIQEHWRIRFKALKVINQVVWETIAKSNCSECEVRRTGLTKNSVKFSGNPESLMKFDEIDQVFQSRCNDRIGNDEEEDATNGWNVISVRVCVVRGQVQRWRQREGFKSDHTKKKKKGWWRQGRCPMSNDDWQQRLANSSTKMKRESQKKLELVSEQHWWSIWNWQKNHF